MTYKLKLLITSVVVCAFASNSALANSMRCGTHLITGGDPRSSPGKYEVLRRCGEPNDRYGDTWIYKSRGATHVLRFTSEGQLHYIQKG